MSTFLATISINVSILFYFLYNEKLGLKFILGIALTFVGVAFLSIRGDLNSISNDKVGDNPYFG